MERGRGFNRGGGINFRGRGRGMMGSRGGGFGGPPRGGMMRGRGLGGPRGPPRMGLGYNSMRGMNPRGRGRGGYQENSDYTPQNGNNIVTALTQTESPEKSSVPTTIVPVSQSGNNVQVVTTQSVPSQQSSSGQSNSIQTNQSMGRDAPRGFGRGRGSFGRGSGFRGRGSFNQGNMPPRQQFDTRQPSNLTQALPPKMNRYDQQGSLPPKRGRYDSPYMGNRSTTQAPPPLANNQGYSNVATHGSSGYQDQSQYGVDQYQHHSGYNSGMQQPQGNYSANGGYNQSFSAPSNQMGYQTEGYDHNSAGYQDYGQSGYDTRGYANYSHDYRQGYNGSADTSSGYQPVTQDSSYSYEARSVYDSYSQGGGYNSQSGYY